MNMAELILENVSYQYPDSHRQVLTGLNGVFPAGTVTAIRVQKGATVDTDAVLVTLG